MHCLMHYLKGVLLMTILPPFVIASYTFSLIYFPFAVCL
jgi:hypothetical protein